MVSHVSVWITILKYLISALNISPEGGLVSLNHYFSNYISLFIKDLLSPYNPCFLYILRTQQSYHD